jgi:hypothetical protein
MKTIELIDSKQQVAAVIEIEFLTDWAFAGDVKTIYGLDEEFFAKVYVKSDGSTHFWYKGDEHNPGNKPNEDNVENFDYDNYEEEVDGNSYYYSDIAGQLVFIRNIAFVLEVLNEKVGLSFDSSKTDYEMIKKLNLLDGYTIIYNLD